jgi:hypothetical protein
MPTYAVQLKAMAKKNRAAQELIRRRWDKTPPEERSEMAKRAAAARWAGHIAKRPASARKRPKHDQEVAGGASDALSLPRGKTI